MKSLKLWKIKTVVSLVLALGFATGVTSLHADEDGPWKTGFVLSFPEEAGATKEVLRQGFGFDFNTTYRKPDSPLGLRVDGIYANFGLSDKVLSHVDGADSGYAVVWGLGTSVSISPVHTKRIKPSLYAGPGFYYERAEATRYGVTTGYICDPWFGCYPALVPGEYGIAKFSTSRLGWQGGADIDFCFDGGGAITIGVQYIRINNTNADTEFIPINVGYTQRF